MLRATVAPTQISASGQRSVIPALVEIVCDCRLLPGQTQDDLEPLVREALGDRGVELEWLERTGGTRSSLHTPLWEAIESFVVDEEDGAALVPILLPGFTDGHFLREAFGTIVYGFFPMRAVDAELAAALVHSADERAAVEDLELGNAIPDPLGGSCRNRRRDTPGRHGAQAGSCTARAIGRAPCGRRTGSSSSLSAEKTIRSVDSVVADSAQAAASRALAVLPAVQRAAPRRGFRFSLPGRLPRCSGRRSRSAPFRSSGLSPTLQEIAGGPARDRARDGDAAGLRAGGLPRGGAHLDRKLRARRAASERARALRSHLLGPPPRAGAAGNALVQPMAGSSRNRSLARLGVGVGSPRPRHRDLRVDASSSRQPGEPGAGWPGGELQTRVATRRADAEQLEVAQAALGECLELELRDAAAQSEAAADDR